MASKFTSSMNSASTPFQLLSQSFPVLRNFLDIMPLQDLTMLRNRDEAVKSLSSFRGEFVKCLNVQTDTFKDYPWFNFTLYSDVMNQRFNTTPLERLTVHMGPDVSPEGLLSKMDGKYFRDLYLQGEYHWTQVIEFLHESVEIVNLQGYMDLPVHEMKEFFETLLSFKIKRVSLQNENFKQFWLNIAYETIHKHIGTTVTSVETVDAFFPRIVAVASDESVMELVGADTGKYEYTVPVDNEFMDEEMEDLGNVDNNDFDV